MSKVAIVQFDDRSDQALGPMLHLVARNAAYAAERGYSHNFIRSHDNAVPVFWHKVSLIEQALADGYEYVAWLDTDAVIHDFGLSIETLFAGPEIMIFSGDLPIYPVPLPFNAGVFFCRGGAARALMAEWRALYPAHLWRKQAGQWNFQDPGPDPLMSRAASPKNCFPNTRRRRRSACCPGSCCKVPIPCRNP